MTQPSDPLWALRIDPAGRIVDLRRITHLHELAGDGSEVAIIASETEAEGLARMLRSAWTVKA